MVDGNVFHGGEDGDAVVVVMATGGQAVHLLIAAWYSDPATKGAAVFRRLRVPLNNDP